MSNTVKNSLQTKPRKGLLDDAEQAIYPNNPRKPGEYEIRSESDVIGKALLEERDRQGREAGKRITGYSLRKKLLPGIPGHVPERLNNLYAVETYLDGLCKLAHDVRRVNHDNIAPVFVSTVNQFIDSVSKTRKGEDLLAMVKFPLKAFWAGVDVMAAGKQQQMLLQQEFTQKSIEYGSYNLAVMMSERRDWFSYRLSEMYRAYASHNRQEWFSMGAALVGIHQNVNYAVMEMERATIKAEKTIEGSTKREVYNVGFRLLESIFKN